MLPLLADGKFLLAYPFLQFVESYVSKAFDFKRAFLWEWTVNWRFLGEEMFSSKQFARTLLIGHALTLLFFTFTRFIKYFPKKKVSLIADHLGNHRSSLSRKCLYTPRPRYSQTYLRKQC